MVFLKVKWKTLIISTRTKLWVEYLKKDHFALHRGNQIATLVLKGCIFHFVKWQIRPFNTKMTKFPCTTREITVMYRLLPNVLTCHDENGFSCWLWESDVTDWLMGPEGGTPIPITAVQLAVPPLCQLARRHLLHPPLTPAATHENTKRPIFKQRLLIFMRLIYYSQNRFTSLNRPTATTDRRGERAQYRRERGGIEERKILLAEQDRFFVRWLNPGRPLTVDLRTR